MGLPSLIVGNELLILAGVGAAVGLSFFPYRHGQLRGLVGAAKAEVVGEQSPNFSDVHQPASRKLALTIRNMALYVLGSMAIIFVNP
jgi:hypothetical protein